MMTSHKNGINKCVPSFDPVLYLIALKLQPDDSLFVILENDDFT